MSLLDRIKNALGLGGSSDAGREMPPSTGDRPRNDLSPSDVSSDIPSDLPREPEVVARPTTTTEAADATRTRPGSQVTSDFPDDLPSEPETRPLDSP